jgi:hypothetical protein
MTEALQIPTSAHDEQSAELDWHTRRSRMAQTASKNCRRATRASVSVRWSQAPDAQTGRAAQSSHLPFGFAGPLNISHAPQSVGLAPVVK